jgi:hypothetical protein
VGSRSDPDPTAILPVRCTVRIKKVPLWDQDAIQARQVPLWDQDACFARRERGEFQSLFRPKRHYGFRPIPDALRNCPTGAAAVWDESRNLEWENTICCLGPLKHSPASDFYWSVIGQCKSWGVGEWEKNQFDSRFFSHSPCLPLTHSSLFAQTPNVQSHFAPAPGAAAVWDKS